MKWEDPPTQTHSSRLRWESEAADLRANPDRWGVVAEYAYADRVRAYNLARNIKAGAIKAFQPLGSFEARSHDDGRVVKVYARYVGHG